MHAFWLFDFLKGNKVKNHLNDITLTLENFNKAEVQYKRKINIDKLLTHAVSTTDFYSKYIEFNSLSDFPIISKIEIREFYSSILSKTYEKRKATYISTSGTTGIPFKVRVDKNKKYRNSADVIYFGNKGRFKVGNRLYYIRKWVKEISRNPINLYITNLREVEVTNFSEDYLNAFLKKIIKDASTNNILGYSSALRDIVKYIEYNKIEITLKSSISSIISIAEALSNNTRKSLEHIFKAPVISRYSNMENGILAQQFIGEGTDFQINWASYHIEVLALNNDQPAIEGQVGRIVVTDLFNYSMPIIRYDTGDLGILSSQNSFFNNAPVLKRIEGRQMDTIFNTQGKPISSYIAFEMEYFSELKQFQLIQEEKELYVVKLLIEGAFLYEKELAERLKIFLGDDAIIIFKYCDGVPVQSSGKRRLTVNNYYK